MQEEERDEKNATECGFSDTWTEEGGGEVDAAFLLSTTKLANNLLPFKICGFIIYCTLPSLSPSPSSPLLSYYLIDSSIKEAPLPENIQCTWTSGGSPYLVCWIM